MSGEGGGTSTGECEGEEQEEPSSFGFQSLEDPEGSDQTQDTDVVEDVLTSFRQQWQRELESPVKQAPKQSSTDTFYNQNNLRSSTPNTEQNVSTTAVESDEDKAKKLFLKGVEHEQNGKLYEAIQFYKRAVQLIPDIEFRLYESTKMKSKGGRDESPNPSSERTIMPEEVREHNSSEDEFEPEDLIAKIERMISRTGCVCSPEYDQKIAHISCLPTELLLYILRWVVSSELDMISLERCAAVCRGFYLCARDQEIWRAVCVKTWGINCGTLKACGFSNWRQMFIERPRLRFNGCYISKTTYLRHGENSFQDQFYRPWHLIEYFRYLRFFPDGLVLMLTTADEPSISCSHLKRYTRSQGVLSGHYRLHGDKAIIVVKKQPASNQNKQFQSTNTRFRPRRKENAQETNLGQTFHLELEIQSQKSRSFSSLVWCGYTIFTKNSNGTDSSNSFEIVRSKFPPFWFSRVKSYHAESESPLQ